MGKKNRRDFLSGLRVSGNGNMSDHVGERGRGETQIEPGNGNMKQRTISGMYYDDPRYNY